MDGFVLKEKAMELIEENSFMVRTNGETEKMTDGMLLCYSLCDLEPIEDCKDAGPCFKISDLISVMEEHSAVIKIYGTQRKMIPTSVLFQALSEMEIFGNTSNTDGVQKGLSAETHS